MSERIIVACHLGHWTAWWESTPQEAFSGATPAEAVDQLHAAYFERVETRQAES